MLAFEASDLLADLHALEQEQEDCVVGFVELSAEVREAGVCSVFAKDKSGYQLSEFVGRELLISVGFGLIGASVCFNHQSVVSEGHSLCGQFGDECGFAGHVGRVENERDVGNVEFERERHGPHGCVAVGGRLACLESAMHSLDVSYSGFPKSLDGTFPEAKIGRDGILDQDSDIGDVGVLSGCFFC